MTESEEELKRLLMKIKEEGENVGLKLDIQKMKIMASGPITSWEIDGETVETVSDTTEQLTLSFPKFNTILWHCLMILYFTTETQMLETVVFGIYSN